MASPLSATSYLDDGFAWDHNVTARLIDLWFESPALYDSTSIDYRDKFKRSNAVAAIAAELGAKEADVRDKMRNLRSQYARERAHEERSSPGSGAKGAYRSKWFYFQKLAFLDEFRRQAKSMGVRRSEISDYDRLGDGADDSGAAGGDAGLVDGVAIDYDDGAGAVVSTSCQTFNAHVSPCVNSTASHDRMPPQTVVIQSTPSSPTAVTNRYSPPPCSEYSGCGKQLPAAASAARSANSRRDAVCRPIANGDGVSADRKRKPDTGSNGIRTLLENLLEDAANSQRRASARVCADEEDDAALFGRFVANELRQMASVRTRRLAKLRVHEALVAAVDEREAPERAKVGDSPHS